VDVLINKNYGVYFEFVVPQTAFITIEALSELEAKKIFESKIAPNHHQSKLLAMVEIKEKQAFPPKKPSPIVAPNPSQVNATNRSS
jgi:hypothetical protein